MTKQEWVKKKNKLLRDFLKLEEKKWIIAKKSGEVHRQYRELLDNEPTAVQ